MGEEISHHIREHTETESTFGSANVPLMALRMTKSAEHVLSNDLDRADYLFCAAQSSLNHELRHFCAQQQENLVHWYAISFSSLHTSLVGHKSVANAVFIVLICFFLFQAVLMMP